MPILEVKNVTKKFGGLVALKDVSMNIDKNTIVGLIGPNGSGKTTLFNVITGFLKPDSGNVLLNGDDITNLKPHQIARKGLCKTFQLTRVFCKLTLLQNLMVASPGGDEAVVQKQALELLEFFSLLRLKDENAGNLSFGQQKLLELARVLIRNPDVILLDEPAAGINPALMEDIIEHIRKLRDIGKTVVMVEHHLSTVFRLAEKVVVLDHGEKICSGPPELVKCDKGVITAYLGDE